jgi:Uma2 family endonuclease
MLIQEKLYTVDEFWEAFGETKRLELVKGVPTEMTPAGTAHGAISMWFGYLILGFVEAHDLGLVTAAETGFILSTDPATVRAPDVGFIAKARLTGPTPEQYFPGPPDLAVEIVSPNDRADEIHNKVMDFLNAGTHLVWVVYPSSKTVAVYHPGSAGHIFTPEDTLDGGGVLPGFSLSVREIFKKLREEHA